MAAPYYDEADVRLRRAIGLLIVLGALVIAWRATGSKPRSDREARGTPTATVEVAPIRRAPIVNRLVAYGRVVGAPWAIHALVQPFEVSVTQVFVNRGQSVAKGAVLLALTPGPKARLASLEAQNRLRLARVALKEERLRLRLRLTTRIRLLQAEKAFDDAKLQVRVFHEEGLMTPMKIRAPVGGVVQHIFVQEGTTIEPGQPLMDIVAGDRLEVRLGVEPEDVPSIRLGENVRLSSFEGPDQAHVHGLVSVISRVMDPATHMINVFATLPAQNPYLLGEYVEGRFTVVSPLGLVVARSAVVPAGHHYVLYTVVDGHAQVHKVRLGARNGRYVQVIDPHLAPGMQAVVLGNYELKLGMPVRLKR